MARVTGIGGVFIYSNDAAVLSQWYMRHFGLAFESYDGPHGTICYLEFPSADSHVPAGKATTVFSIMPPESPPLPTRKSPEFRMNYRTPDLPALIAQLREEGIEVEGPSEDFNGMFARTEDPDGNAIELFQAK